MTAAAYIPVDGKDTLLALLDAQEKLSDCPGDLVLDFSGVDRVAPAVLGLLEELARSAEEKARRVTLHGTNVEVYKVLKLAKLTSRFAFTT
jgi:ABC-type transporter Mla MlaB component